MHTTANAIAEKVQTAIAALEANPDAGLSTYRAKVEFDSGTRCLGYVRKFPALVVDEPASLGGQDSGPNPVELLLVSLGACQEIAYSLFSSVMGIQLDSVTVRVKGRLNVRGVLLGDPEFPAGYQDITFETRIESSADRAEIEKLVDLVESRCPTMDTLRRPIDVQGVTMLNGERLAAG